MPDESEWINNWSSDKCSELRWVGRRDLLAVFVFYWKTLEYYSVFKQTITKVLKNVYYFTKVID